VQTIRWEGDVAGSLVLIDQTALPEQCVARRCRDVASVVEAIRSLRVRGAPAIGLAAAYGVCLGAQAASAAGDRAAFLAQLERAIAILAASRPTAVNLFWALDRMRRTATSQPPDRSPQQIASALLDQARAMHQQDRDTCHAIGRHGAALLRDGQGVLTHCNAGALATAEYGTALGVLRAAHQSGKHLHVYADETRPLLQGARLTAWELDRDGLEVTVICDVAAAHVIGSGRVDVVLTGADRIAANGDSANKIGTYGLALLAAAHEIPFYIAAPRNTFDLSIASGDQIPIEERGADEISQIFGTRTVPEGVPVYNPAFDVTPARLITAIICEAGIIRPVDPVSIRRIVGSA